MSPRLGIERSPLPGWIPNSTFGKVLLLFAYFGGERTSHTGGESTRKDSVKPDRSLVGLREPGSTFEKDFPVPPSLCWRESSSARGPCPDVARDVTAF